MQTSSLPHQPAAPVSDRLTGWHLAIWLTSMILLAGWLYWPAREAGFISDFTGHQMLFENGSALGWWNSFGWHGNQPVLFGLMFWWYQQFGIQPLPWYWLFIGLHGFNATLLGLVGHRIWRRATDPGKAISAAFILSVLYLVHPYQTEVVVWKVCLHYLLSTAVLLGSILLLFRDRPLSGQASWIALHVAFLIALFSLELALIYPVILGLSVWWWGREESWSRLDIRLLWMKIGIPQAVFILVYFLLNKWRMGVWVGHYGDDVHLRFSLLDLAGNGLNYLVKYLAFSRDWVHEAKAMVAGFPASQPGWLATVLASLILSYVAFWLRDKRLNRLSRTALWAGGLFPLALAPVLSLHFAWIGYVENDRYGYLALAFFLLAIQSLLLQASRWIILGVWILLLAIQFNLTRANIDRWEEAQRLYEALLADWRWSDAEDVFILGLPDNYQGISVFRSFFPGETLRDGLQWSAGKEVKGTLREVSAFQAGRISDGLAVVREDSVTWKVDLRQWGTWFLRKGLGASDYAENGYRVTYHEGGYRIRFDTVDTSRVLVYSDGGRWIQVPVQSN